MTILHTIVERKRTALAIAKERVPQRMLEEGELYRRPTRSLKERLLRAPGVIAEFKRRSPSKGDIHPDADVRVIAAGYEEAGAAAISVLTESEFFGGSSEDLTAARSVVSLPVLMKDFVVDPYQIHLARAIGADLILLIASLLNREEIEALTELAHQRGLEVLLEVHTADEIDRCYSPRVDLVGVNCRDLKDFSVDTARAKSLRSALPPSAVIVAESGIDSPATVNDLIDGGYHGFLIGEAFMRHRDPVDACRRFIRQLSTRTR